MVMLGSKMESIIRSRIVSYRRDVECELKHTYVMTDYNGEDPIGFILVIHR